MMSPTIKIESSDLYDPIEDDIVIEPELDIRIYEPEEKPLEITITEVFPEVDITITDSSDEVKIDFIDEQVQRIEIEVANERDNAEAEIERLVQEINIIEMKEEAVPRIQNIRNLEERLRALLRLLQTLGISDSERNKLVREIRRLEARIREIYLSMVKILTFDDVDTTEEEEVEIQILDGEDAVDTITISESDLKRSGVSKERLPDGSYVIGLQDFEKLRSSYGVEFAPGVFNEIIRFSKEKGSRTENGGVLAGRFDDHNRKVIIEMFIGAPDSFIGTSTTFHIPPELWSEFLPVLDRYNDTHPGSNRVMVGWFHTHPRLRAFLSQANPENPSVPGDLNVHNHFVNDRHIAMVYDPVNEELNTWNTVPIPDIEEQNMLDQMGRSYTMPNGRVLRHVPNYVIKGDVDSDQVKKLNIQQASR